MNSRISSDAVAELSRVGPLAKALPAAVQQLNPLLDRRWERLVERHTLSSIFHTTGWLTALHSAYGYEPIVLSTGRRMSELDNGMVFCSVKSLLTGSRLVSLPFSDHCEPLASNDTEITALVAHAQQKVDDGQSRYCEIRPLLFTPDSRTQLTQSSTYQFHILDLRRRPEDIFRKFHKDCVQRKIRRAEREGLRYEEGHSDELLYKFYRLMVITRRRQGLPPQPLRWFRSLISAFKHDLKIRVASKDNVPVASILTLTHKKSMVYKYGCSDAELNRFGGMPFLFWRAIEEAVEKGCEELDMGRSDRENLGLITFKGHLGAEAKAVRYWTYPSRSGTSASGWKAKVVRGIVSVSPDWALTIAGSLLYRHIG